MVHKVLYGNWKTTTFIAALRHDRVTAPFVLEGAMNGETFRAYVEQILAPTLKRGEIALMDNVPIHKVAGVREAIEARGAILIYLPAYSPDFNPIEQVFAKLKAVLRKIAAYTLTGAAYSIRQRQAVRDVRRVATCLEFGPRFLHSTGQAYKGGPNTGVFLQITCNDAVDLPVPGRKYTFGVVKAAQARGDFDVLVKRDRRALRVHLGADLAAGLSTLRSALLKALGLAPNRSQYF